MLESQGVTVVVGRLEPLVGCGVVHVLGEDPRVRLLASDLEDDALEDAVIRQAPRVVILDEVSACSVLERLREIAPATGVLALAHDPVLEYGLRVLAAGATCIARNASTADLLAAVYLVARGERMFMSADGERVQRRYPSGAPILTRRESDVFRCLSEGKSHAETACDLGIGVRTVHTYAARVYRKLNVRSKRELIAMLPPSDSDRD